MLIVTPTTRLIVTTAHYRRYRTSIQQNTGKTSLPTTIGCGWPLAKRVRCVKTLYKRDNGKWVGILTGGTNNATNQLFPNPGFEPIVLREVQRVTRAGPGWFEFDNLYVFEGCE